MKGNNSVKKILSGCGWLILFVIFGTAVAIGIAAGNFWVGVGVWFSVTVTLIGVGYYVVEDDLRTYLWSCWGSFLCCFSYMPSMASLDTGGGWLPGF